MDLVGHQAERNDESVANGLLPWETHSSRSNSVPTRCVDDEEEEAQVQRRSGWRGPLAPGHAGVDRPWVAWSGAPCGAEAWAAGVRAGASARGADATSAHMYICVGLRLSSADLVAVFFSAFWLRSSVVSVLFRLIPEMWTICPLLN